VTHSRQLLEATTPVASTAVEDGWLYCRGDVNPSSVLTHEGKDTRRGLPARPSPGVGAQARPWIASSRGVRYGRHCDHYAGAAGFLPRSPSKPRRSDYRRPAKLSRPVTEVHTVDVEIGDVVMGRETLSADGYTGRARMVVETASRGYLLAA